MNFIKYCINIIIFYNLLKFYLLNYKNHKDYCILLKDIILDKNILEFRTIIEI